MAMFTDDDIDFEGATFFTDDDIDFEGAVFFTDDDIDFDGVVIDEAPEVQQQVYTPFEETTGLQDIPFTSMNLEAQERRQESFEAMPQEDKAQFAKSFAEGIKSGFEEFGQPDKYTLEQQNKAIARQKQFEEKEKRRKANKLTKSEKLLDVAFTEDVMRNPDLVNPKGLEGAVAGVGGFSSLLARAAGSLIGQGDIEDESTKVFKPLIENTRKWVESREAQNTSADVMIESLRKALDEKALTGDQRKRFEAQIEKAEDSKNSGALTTAVDVMNTFSLETISDPAAWLGVIGSAFNIAKGIGKTVFRKTGKELAEKTIGYTDDMFAILGIDKRMVDFIEKQPGANVKQKLKAIRDRQTGGTSGGRLEDAEILKKFDERTLKELESNVDEVQKALDEIPVEQTGAISGIEKDYKIKELEKQSEISEKKELISKTKESIEDSIEEIEKKYKPNSAEEFIKKQKGKRLENVRESVEGRIKLIDEDIAKLKENQTARAALARELMQQEKESINHFLDQEMAMISQKAEDRIGEAKRTLKRDVEKISKETKREIEEMLPEIEAEDIVDAISNERKLNNISFEESNDIGKQIPVSQIDAIKTARDMLVSWTGGVTQGRNYNADAIDLITALRPEASFEEVGALLKKKGYGGELTDAVLRIRRRNVADLKKVNKALSKAQDKAVIDPTSPRYEIQQGFKSEISEKVAKIAGPESMAKILEAESKGGQFRDAAESLYSVLGTNAKEMGKLNPNTRRNTLIRKLDNFMDKEAKKLFENGMTQTPIMKEGADLSEWKKLFGVDTKKEIVRRAQRLNKAKTGIEKIKSVEQTAKITEQDIKSSIAAEKTEATKTASKKKARVTRKARIGIAEDKANLLNVLREKGVSRGSLNQRLEKAKKDIAEFDANRLNDIKKAKESAALEKKQTISEGRKSIEQIKKAISESESDLKRIAEEKYGDINAVTKEFKKKADEIRSKLKKAQEEYGLAANVVKEFEDVVGRFTRQGGFSKESPKFQEFVLKYGEEMGNLVEDQAVLNFLSVASDGTVTNKRTFTDLFGSIGGTPMATKLRWGEKSINKALSKIKPYNTRIERVITKIKKKNKELAKDLNRINKRGGNIDDALKLLNEKQPLMTADILSSEFKFLSPLDFYDKAFLLSVANSTDNTYTAREKMAAKRMLQQVKSN